MTKKTREIIFNKYGGKCAYTGKDLGNDWQVDHITPKHHYSRFYVQGNPNDIDNLFPTIKIINHYKRGQDLNIFRRYITTLHIRISKLPKKTIVKRTEKRKEYILKVAELFDITTDKPFSGKFYFEKITQTNDTH